MRLFKESHKTSTGNKTSVALSGPVHTYPHIFESAALSFRIQKFPRPHVVYSNRPGLQSAVCILYLVCILYPVYSLYFVLTADRMEIRLPLIEKFSSGWFNVNGKHPRFTLGEIVPDS